MDDGLSGRLARLGRGLLKPPRGGVKQVLRHATEMLSHLTAGAPLAAAPAAMPGAPDGGDFGANPGALRMLMHLPRTPRRGAPLLVLLHGCTQDAENFAAASGFVALADRLGAPLLLPEQQAANNQGRCFNWFRAADIARGGGEAASVRQMIADAVPRYQCDPSRVFVAGLSAGGAMAAALLAAYPDVFAAGAVVAGLPVGVAKDVASAMTRMAQPVAESRAALAARIPPRPPGAAWPRLSVWHGDADRTVSPGNGDALVAQWAGLLNLPEAPDTDARPAAGVRRRAWGTALEQWTIAGYGHGFPVTGGATRDPYVLPAPVQAADAIARFWGLERG